MTGHMGVSPCLKCKTRGVRDVENGKRTYYCPLHQPHIDGQPARTWNLRQLEPRTHDDFLQAVKELDEAPNKTHRAQLAKWWGISGRSYILDMPGTCMIRSCGIDGMHLYFENIAPTVTKIWVFPTFKGLDQGTGSYVLSEAVWAEVGQEIVAANKTIPSAFVRSMPNIATEMSSFTAEAWSFWICYQAPILLRDRLPTPYYSHLLLLGDIILNSLQLEISRADLQQLREDCIKWVQDYEP